MTVAQVALGLLRQQLAPGQMMHGIVTDGGAAPNVIPARAAMRYTMRAADAAALRELEDRVGDCFLAGALATGCDYEVSETEPSHEALAPDAWLADAFRAEMQRLGRTPLPPDVEVTLPLGSTDMGNVTQVMPGIHPIVSVGVEGVSVHQPDFAAAAVSAGGDAAVIDGAVLLARTVVALAQAPQQRSRVLELAERRAAS